MAGPGGSDCSCAGDGGMKEDNLIVVRPMTWLTSAGERGQLFSRGVTLMTPSISPTVQRAFTAVITTSEETVGKEEKVEMKAILCD